MRTKFDFLLKAIDEVEETIRFLDTKAGVLVIFLSSIFIFTISEFLDGSFINNVILFRENISPDYFISTTILFFLYIIGLLISIVLIFNIIFPNSSAEKFVDLSVYKPKHLFYLNEIDTRKRIVPSVVEYSRILREMNEEDIIKELIFELEKLSFIRRKKHKLLNKVITLLGIILFFLLLVILLFFFGYF